MKVDNTVNATSIQLAMMLGENYPDDCEDRYCEPDGITAEIIPVSKLDGLPSEGFRCKADSDQN